MEIRNIIRGKRSILLSVMGASVGLWLFLVVITGSAQSASISGSPSASTTAALEIDMLGPDSTFANELVTYTIILTNTSGGTLDNVIVTDTWTTKMAQDINDMWGYGVLALFEGYSVEPVGAVAASSHRVNDDNKRGEATWQLSPLAADDSVTIIVTARVPITLQPTLKAYEPISGTGDEEVIGPSTVENTVVALVQGETSEAPLVTTQVLAPVLSITKSAVGEVAGENLCRVGRLLTYTIVVRNAPQEGSGARPDTHPALHLVVYDQLPIDSEYKQPIDFITGTAEVAGVQVTESGNIVTWTFPNDFVLDKGENVTLTFVARVPVDVVYGPRTEYWVNQEEGLRAHADAMPYRDALLAKDHKVRILSPFDKVVATSSPPPETDRTFPNRFITYTLTFYNPLYDTDIADMLLEDQLPTLDGHPELFSFSRVISGDLGDPAMPVSGSLLQWEGVNVPANGAVSVTFEVFVSPQTPARGPYDCRTSEYPNAVFASFGSYAFVGHNSNKLAPVDVEMQLAVTKSPEPLKQIAGSEITYTIKLENLGDTPIHPPLALTDTIPFPLQYLAMVSDPPPGEPELVSETTWYQIYRWDDVLTNTLAPGESTQFSYKVLAVVIGDDIPNTLDGYSEETKICSKPAKVDVIAAIRYDKVASETQVVQGDLIHYTIWTWNVSPVNVFTMTQFMDQLERDNPDDDEYKGTRDIADGDEWYEYDLPAPFRLEPQGMTVWEHTFPVRAVGYGIGHPWCELRKDPNESYIVQKGDEIYSFFTSPDSSYVGFEKDQLAKVCVFPNFSLFQQADPNPIATGQIFTTVLSIRDNRTSPITELTGVELTWQVPQTGTESGYPFGAFEVLDSVPPYDEEVGGLFTWNNVTVPKGGIFSVTLHLRAPLYEKPSGKISYPNRKGGFVARVPEFPDPLICIPHAEKFALWGALPTSCADKLESLVMNQGIEIEKTPDPEQVPPYGLVNYELIVSNLTGAPVSNVVITDVLPSLGDLHWKFEKMISGPEPVSTDPLVWVLDSVPAQDEVVINFGVRTHQFLGFEYNQVLGEAPVHLSLHADYTEDVEVEVVSGVGFFKFAEPDSIIAGENTTYTIMLHNGSDNTLSDFTITDTLPTGFTFTHVIAPPDTIPTVNGEQLIWHVPTQVKPNTTLKLIYGVETDVGLFSGYYFSNLTGAATNEATHERQELPSSEDIAPVYVKGVPQVLADKRASPSEINANEDVTYTITLFNETDDPYDVILTDTLPYSFTFVGAVGAPAPSATIPGARERVVWNLATVAAQETVTLTFKARADYFAESGSYCNDIQVQMGPFVLPKRTGGCVYVNQIPRVDVHVSKSDGQLQTEAGETLTYTIHYTNSADSEAVAYVQIMDSFAPADVITASGGPGWTQVGNAHVFEAGPLAPGESGSVLFSLELDSDIPPSVLVIENQATVSYTSTEETIEAGKDDNTAIDTTFLSAPDLTITDLWVEPTDPCPGSPMTVTIVVENQGSNAITQRWDGSTDNPDELFMAELYLKPHPSSPPADAFDHELGWSRGEEYIVWLDGRLDPGESEQATFHVTAPGSGHYDLYAQVDVSQPCQETLCYYWGKLWGLIPEPFEDNNITTALSLSVKNAVYLPLVLRES